MDPTLHQSGLCFLAQILAYIRLKNLTFLFLEIMKLKAN